MADDTQTDIKSALGPPPFVPTPRVEMCEGVEGMWKYHLRIPGEHMALCGHPTMSTPAGLDLWGYVGHMNEGYCDTCRGRAGYGP